MCDQTTKSPITPISKKGGLLNETLISSSKHAELCQEVEFITLYNFIVARYSINVFRYNLFEFGNKKRYSPYLGNKCFRQRFNYQNFKDEELYPIFKSIQKLCWHFRNLYTKQLWTDATELEYIDFINKNLGILVDKLFVPIESADIIPDNIWSIVSSFRKTAPKKPSSKINYDSDIVRELLGLPGIEPATSS